MATAKKTAAPSTALTKPKATSGAVATIQDRLRAQAAAISSKVAPASGISITCGGKEFKMPDGRKTRDPIELVVVDFLSANTFYDRPFDKENPCPPACFAIGDNPLELVPSDASPAKQADDCASCPMNQFGSNGKGKACGNGRKLAVLPPDAHEETPLWLLNVSPTSLRSFDGFVRGVANTMGMPPVAVVATVSFDEAADYPKLEFGNPVPNENLEVCFNRQAEARKLLETQPDVSGYQPPAPVKAARPPVKSARR